MSFDALLAQAATDTLTTLGNEVTLVKGGVSAVVSVIKERDVDVMGADDRITTFGNVFTFKSTDAEGFVTADLIKEDVDDTSQWWNFSRVISDDGVLAMVLVTRYVAGR